jgi:hypothetical protein
VEFTEARKWLVWNHFVARYLTEGTKMYGATQALTGKRIGKVWQYVWKDKAFWMDILTRHDLLRLTPESLEQMHPGSYQHAKGNFWGMLLHIAAEKGIVR